MWIKYILICRTDVITLTKKKNGNIKNELNLKWKYDKSTFLFIRIMNDRKGTKS